MDLLDTTALIIAGLAAGVTNAIAGGGSLITFPTLVATGLPPIAANVTNSVAVSPGYLASAYAGRADLVSLAATRGSALLQLLPTAVVGTAVGCAVLLLTPARTFDLVVPFLVLVATVAVAARQRLRALVGPHDMTSRRRALALHATVALGSAYGGYFGAALGVMMVAALGLLLDERLAVVTALKNAISAVVGVGTVLAFALFGPVDWAAAAVLAPATLAGGYIGGRLVPRLSAAVLNVAIVVIGLAVAAVLFVRAF